MYDFIFLTFMLYWSRVIYNVALISHLQINDSLTHIHLKVKELVAQSCPALCDPMNCSSPSSSIHGILQARILEWVAIPFSRECS